MIWRDSSPQPTLSWGHHLPIGVKPAWPRVWLTSNKGRFPKSAEVLQACPKAPTRMGEETRQSWTQSPLLSAPLNKEEVPTARRFLRDPPSTAPLPGLCHSLKRKGEAWGHVNTYVITGIGMDTLFNLSAIMVPAPPRFSTWPNTFCSSLEHSLQWTL